jgi:hypothetical protein
MRATSAIIVELTVNAVSTTLLAFTVILGLNTLVISTVPCTILPTDAVVVDIALRLLLVCLTLLTSTTVMVDDNSMSALLSAI